MSDLDYPCGRCGYVDCRCHVSDPPVLRATVAEERRALREWLATQPASASRDRLRVWLDAREGKGGA